MEKKIATVIPGQIYLCYHGVYNSRTKKNVYGFRDQEEAEEFFNAIGRRGYTFTCSGGYYWNYKLGRISPVDVD